MLTICNNIYKCWDVKPYQSQENKNYPKLCVSIPLHPQSSSQFWQVPLAQTEIRPSAPPLQMYLPDSQVGPGNLWDDMGWGATNLLFFWGRVNIGSINLTLSTLKKYRLKNERHFEKDLQSQRCHPRDGSFSKQEIYHNGTCWIASQRDSCLSATHQWQNAQCSGKRTRQKTSEVAKKVVQ